MLFDDEKRAAFKAAFPYTVPIFAGYAALGIGYGIYMKASGFSTQLAVILSIIMYAGAGQFVAVGMMLGPFTLFGNFLLMVLVNARHIFYGISMLDKYKDMGALRWYLAFAMTDETFSINCTVTPPENVSRKWFYFFITLLDHSYWVFGTALGCLCGALMNFNTRGIDFVMTAIILVIFLNMMNEKDLTSGFIGIFISLICLLMFGTHFVIPSMIAILAALALRRRLTEGTRS